ncbi:28 kDa heat- and acid-stable phosphoprotein [Lutzomyia longipalpis]|uniref:28 kDa heat- and acid-stable phosphoprotein n=1 Tax=Lutzomyia longipalpis TaxID=7200 RepID=UPI0024836081|nr:28 kDa heat- and acid-stable phosphoprotein [Lutzomyia longipalpis]
MPRGKFVNHKGRSRHFTNPEELEEERRKEQKKKLQKESDSESESPDEEEEESEGGDEEDEEESEEEEKPKGVSGLIDIENPNRVTKKTIQKVGRMSLEEGEASKPELTRREQEQIQKQKARRQYMKLHAEGKTKQAREDLARLAIIKQHRAEAAARREQEKKEKEEARKKASNA